MFVVVFSWGETRDVKISPDQVKKASTFYLDIAT